MVEAACQSVEGVLGPLLEGLLLELEPELVASQAQAALAGVQLSDGEGGDGARFPSSADTGVRVYESLLHSAGVSLPPFKAADCLQVVASVDVLQQRLPITIRKRAENALQVRAGPYACAHAAGEGGEMEPGHCLLLETSFRLTQQLPCMSPLNYCTAVRAAAGRRHRARRHHRLPYRHARRGAGLCQGACTPLAPGPWLAPVACLRCEPRAPPRQLCALLR